MKRMNTIGQAVAIASLALLAGAWAWRGADVAPQADLRAERSSVQVPDEVFTPEPVVQAAAGERADRESVLRTTEEFIGLSPDEAVAFRTAVLSAVEDVDRAWRVREEGWMAVSSSAASDPELLSRLENEIQSRYESEKETALRRVAAHLRGSERRERLHDRLEEWFDELR